MVGRLEEGLVELEEAVLRFPCSSRARGKLAATLMQVGRIDEAVRHLETALAFQPNNPQLRVLAQQLEQQGVPFREASARP
jgi:Flp pilus assembly protein TadD